MFLMFSACKTPCYKKICKDIKGMCTWKKIPLNLVFICIFFSFSIESPKEQTYRKAVLFSQALISHKNSTTIAQTWPWLCGCKWHVVQDKTNFYTIHHLLKQTRTQKMRLLPVTGQVLQHLPFILEWFEWSFYETRSYRHFTRDKCKQAILT